MLRNPLFCVFMGGGDGESGTPPPPLDLRMTTYSSVICVRVGQINIFLMFACHSRFKK